MTTHHQFFELQRHYKRNSLMLYFLFVMAMMIHVVVALLVFMVAWYFIVGVWTEFLWFWIVLIIPSYFILNVLYQYNKITHNHDLILKDIEVKRLFINVSGLANSSSQNVICVNYIKEFEPKYRRYYQFAEQLAIASNIYLPKLYVMNDKGINAFVAGFDDYDMMLVVSEGALQLDNESLYGLIGHEYGHILHGDAKLNVKMYVLMSSLSWLYDVADSLEWISKWRQNPKVKRYYLTNDKGQKREYVQVVGVGRLSIEFISLMIRLVGFLGMASGEWIKQHFNRQREFLADATSIQLTRSNGVTKLLKILQQNPFLTKSKKCYTTHLSYFFFLNPHNDYALSWRERIGDLGNTHPDNHERIHALYASDYEDFAKMAIAHLDVTKLQRTYDDMMALQINDSISHISKHPTNHYPTSSKITPNVIKDQLPNIIPVYDKPIMHLQEKVLNDGLVVDNTDIADNVIYPSQAKADYELVNVQYISINHIKKLHLPLIINRFLHNNDVGRDDLTQLFQLFYAVMICHDKNELCLDKHICFGDVFYEQDGHDRVLTIDRSLLMEVAKTDRRIDHGLLCVIYQRIYQDLCDKNKQSWLMGDFYQLCHYISYGNHQNTNNNSLATLWQGVHLYGLLSVFDKMYDFEEIYQMLFDKLIIKAKQYCINHNEWVVILLLIKIITSHQYDHHKSIHTIYRYIRLINSQLSIHQDDLESIIMMIFQCSAVDIALLLCHYQNDDLMMNKRYLDTLHTSLLGNGVFDECDYEIMSVLYDKWCPNTKFIPTL
ncbi:M48 family metalloprotease [Moraxella oblonga]|uniref:M48 family metalloprotease n=1 Tax=Moraxella oblonga TaxID=200413 RepID=UPI0008336DFE|nr:M48 family metalloprotease [Moraxella oblonga]